MGAPKYAGVSCGESVRLENLYHPTEMRNVE